MHRIKAFVLVLCVTTGTLGFAQTSAQTTSQTPGTSTGQRIGNAISAAVTTAFPAVSKILDAIWPTRNQKPDDKKTANQAQTALQTTKTVADSAQKQNLQDLRSAANDLAVARSFMTSTAEIVARISAMESMLASRPPGAIQLSESEKERLQDLWGPAKTRLDALQADKIGQDIDTLSDTFLKSTFTDVRNAITDYGANISNQLTQGRAADLRNSLEQLQPKFVNLGPLTAILIGDLSSSLKQAVNNVSGAAGQETDESAAADRQSNLNLIKASFNRPQ